jgi:DnaJ family protein C protein 28
MNRLETLVEKKIREAMEAGEFDDLPGKGQPIDLTENPFEDPDLRMVHRLLRQAGFAPAWIEERKDIDAELEKSRVTLSRAWKLFGQTSGEGHPDWQRNVAEFREKVVELNSRIRVYNLKAPGAVFQRQLIDVERALEQIQQET